MAPGLVDGLFSGILGGGAPTSSGAGDILPSLPLSVPPLSIPGLPGLPSLSLAPSAPVASSTNPLSVVPTSLSAPPSSSLLLSSSTPAPIPVSSASPSSVVSADPPAVSSGDNGAVKTVSKVVTATASGSQSSGTVGASSHTSSFLQNKPLAGAVFALVGIVVLVLLFVATTFFVRRRRRSRLEDAVSFDPGLISAAERSESGRASLGSGRGMAAYDAAPRQYYGQQQQYEPQQYGQQYTQYGQPQYGMQAGMQPEYYQRQTEYAYVPPMADGPGPQRNIPRSLMPAQAGPVPEQDRRTSTEEADFWARTLRMD